MYMKEGHGFHLTNKERSLSNEERQWLDKLLSFDFKGRNIINEQVDFCSVVGYCGCGCRTIDLHVDRTLPKYPFEKRIPVEMIVTPENEVPIVFYLHVVDGYINELEVFKADSSPINQEIAIDKAIVRSNMD